MAALRLVERDGVWGLDGPWPEKMELSHAQMQAVISSHSPRVFSLFKDGSPVGPPVQKSDVIRITTTSGEAVYRCLESLGDGARFERLDDLSGLTTMRQDMEEESRLIQEALRRQREAQA